MKNNDASPWKAKIPPLETSWTNNVSPQNNHNDYPRPQMVRDSWLNLNGLWQYQIVENLDQPPFQTDLGNEILVPFPVESALSGVMENAEYLWYRKLISLADRPSGSRILLHFGAVDWETVAYVNGHVAGEHQGGFDPFYFDITDFIIEGDVQEIVIGVFDPSDVGFQPRGKQVKKPESIWYTPTTGIWQTVWIEYVPETFIESIKIVPDVDASYVKITVLTNKIKPGLNVLIHPSFQNQYEKIHHGEANREIIIPLKNPKLWSPRDPNLYDVEIKLFLQDREIDKISSYFGMRKIELKKDDFGIMRIQLNNEFVFQMGVLDQGFWPDGLYTAPSDEALSYDIQVTKKLGFNMSRKHVKVEPQRWYYHCDIEGLLVWQDMPSGNMDNELGHQHYQRELKQLINNLKNHPCIVSWVIFNEAWGQFQTEEMTKLARELDPTRIVNSVSGWHDKKCGDLVDIHCYPGPGWIEPEENRAAVIGEYGGPRLEIKNHIWQEGGSWGYFNLANKNELTQKYVEMARNIYSKIESPGISAAVFTQLTDVEVECNGLLTYDRHIIKINSEKVENANKGNFQKLDKHVIIMPTSQQHINDWRFNLSPPENGWTNMEFDDSNWEVGPAGFGTKHTPQSYVRTSWNTANIWLRRTIDLNFPLPSKLFLLVHHHCEVEVYLNSVKIVEQKNLLIYPREYFIPDEIKKRLLPKDNLIAVHCHSNSNCISMDNIISNKREQYFDLSLIGIQ